MIEDPELLRRFATDKSQTAFAEIVRRRVDLVYTVALRHVGGDAHLAQDVTQKVFIDLARKAPALADRAVLSGWLYRSAQYAASDVVRSERRRRVREQESHLREEAALPPVSPDDWRKLRPLLDEALGELDDADRDAVALRFFEDQPFAEIGRVLHVTEDTARKRVERALGKLSATLSRRGVKSTSGALGLALTQQVFGAAPAGVAASVTQAVWAGTVATAAATAGWAAFFSGKVAVGVSAAAAAVALGFAVRESRTGAEQARELAAVREERTAARAAVARLEKRLAASEARVTMAEQDTADLLTAVEKFRVRRGGAGEAAAAAASETPAPAANGALTRENVDARYRNGQRLARAGRGAEALQEFVWCLDRGMPAVTGYSGVRRSFLLGDIERLGEPGLALLRARRDAAEQAVQREGSFDAAADFTAINRVLGEEPRSLALYDALPAGSPGRDRMGIVVYDALIERQRYAEAARTRSFASMLRLFELDSAPRPGAPAMQRDFTLRTAARNIEVLAGAGLTADARTFAAKVLALDASPNTRELLQTHATRAGQPELFRGVAGW